MPDNVTLVTDNKKLQARVRILEQENAFLREEFNLARHRQFSASSE